MQTITLNISNTDYNNIMKLEPNKRSDYVEENILTPYIKCGCGYYGIVDIQNNHIDIRVGDSCE